MPNVGMDMSADIEKAWEKAKQDFTGLPPEPTKDFKIGFTYGAVWAKDEITALLK